VVIYDLDWDFGFYFRCPVLELVEENIVCYDINLVNSIELIYLFYYVRDYGFVFNFKERLWRVLCDRVEPGGITRCRYYCFQIKSHPVID
jgi:hypothetical protein